MSPLAVQTRHRQHVSAFHGAKHVHICFGKTGRPKETRGFKDANVRNDISSKRPKRQHRGIKILLIRYSASSNTGICTFRDETTTNDNDGANDGQQQKYLPITKPFSAGIRNLLVRPLSDGGQVIHFGWSVVWDLTALSAQSGLNKAIIWLKVEKVKRAQNVNGDYPQNQWVYQYRIFS